MDKSFHLKTFNGKYKKMNIEKLNSLYFANALIKNLENHNPEKLFILYENWHKFNMLDLNRYLQKRNLPSSASFNVNAFLGYAHNKKYGAYFSSSNKYKIRGIDVF